jgi:hypothetical protein
MFCIYRPWRAESVVPLISDNRDRMPPRLKVRALDVFDASPYGKVVDVPGWLVLRSMFQDVVRDFGSKQIMA